MILATTDGSLSIRCVRRTSADVFWLPALALLIAGFSLTNWLAYEDYVFEDAFITYRYADNLAAGNGFVFNPGERLLGTTTPLYTLVLALARRLGLEIPATSGALFALSLAACALLGSLILRRLRFPALALIYATIVLLGPNHLPHHFGMETPFYTALLLGALVAAIARWPLTTGLLLGLAFLTRYDGVLLAAVLLPVLWWRERRLPWRQGLVALLVATPWLAFAQSYFGSVLPNTLAAKRDALDVASYLYQAAAIQLRNLWLPIEKLFPDLRLAPVAVALCGLLLIAWPILACTRALVRREPVAVATLAFPMALWVGYAIIAPPTYHAWHLIPGTLILLLHCCAAWGVMTERLRWNHASWAPARFWTTAAMATAVAVLYLPAAQRDARTLVATDRYASRIGVYTTMARWITERDLNDLTVLTPEPGYFSYLSKNPMVDGAGLVTEDIRFHQQVGRTAPSDIIAARTPDLVVSSPPHWPGAKALDGYVPLFHAVPARTLMIRRKTLHERYPSLSRAWLERVPFWPGSDRPLAHPLHEDFEGAGLPPGWSASGNLGGVVGRAGRARYRRAAVVERYLHTFGEPPTWGTISSPPFIINFDALSFRFGGTGADSTRARLLVDGQEVATESAPAGGPNPPEMTDIEWPVMTWRGKVGVLQLVDEDRAGGFAVADRLRSIAYAETRLLDDFEDDAGGGAYSAFWTTTFGARPTTLSDVGAHWGLAFQVGRFGAISAHQSGPVEMESVPFRLEGDALSMLVFDFGGPATRVELRIEGAAVRMFRGEASRRLTPVLWQVAELRGQTARLAIVDEHPSREVWIGVDDIYTIQRSRPRR